MINTELTVADFNKDNKPTYLGEYTRVFGHLADRKIYVDNWLAHSQLRKRCLRFYAMRFNLDNLNLLYGSMKSIEDERIRDISRIKNSSQNTVVFYVYFKSNCTLQSIISFMEESLVIYELKG